MTNTRTSWVAVMAASIGGFGLLLAPAERTNRIRAVVRDAAYPGLWVIDAAYQEGMAIRSRFNTPPAQDTASDTLLAELDGWRQRCRELQTINAHLVNELEQIRSGHGSPFLAEPGTPLFVPELIDANVIGAEELQLIARRVSFHRVVDVGAAQEVIPSDYVVSAASASDAHGSQVIDQGDDSGVRTDQPVFAGRCVVGKVGDVGRWTSTVIPLTDAAFRGRAQLVRTAQRGLVLGAEGVITGDGKGRCRLLHIPSTEPVAAGDEVYTSSRLSGLPVPMYYGRVLTATLPEGAQQWEIVVEPAATMDSTRVVQVLRSVLNAARTETGSTTSEASR